jgi:hypothetical protein
VASDEIHVFQVTVPAGTTKAAPVTSDVSVSDRHIDSIRWRIQGGAIGLMGWRLTSSGNRIIPRNQNSWIIADGESDTWDMKNQHTTGKWEIVAYNSDIYDHTVYLTFKVSILTQAWHPINILGAADLSPAPDLSHAGQPIPGWESWL